MALCNMIILKKRIIFTNAANMPADTGRTAIIRPTGTGKSYISLKVCEVQTGHSKICKCQTWLIALKVCEVRM